TPGWRPACLLGLVLFAVAPSPPAELRPSAVVDDAVDSRALRGNLFGDSPRRAVDVYLPPGYAKQPERRDPGGVLLPGYRGNGKQGMGGAEWDIRDVMDRLIAAGKSPEMIVVMPDVKSRLGGSFYTDSVAAGNWEEFLSRELVAHVDHKYRTLARPA